MVVAAASAGEKCLGCRHPTLDAPDEPDHPERGGDCTREVDAGVDVPADDGGIERCEASPESAGPEHVSLRRFRRTPQFVCRRGVRYHPKKLYQAVRDERVALSRDEPARHDDSAAAEAEALHPIEGKLTERPIERSPHEHGD